MIKQLKDWWSRPPARERVMAALSATEWRSGFMIMKTSKVWTGTLYPILVEMEADGVVDSKWEEGPIPPERRLNDRGYRRRLYRLKPDGRRSRSTNTLRESPAANVSPA